jgi:hypothetical protein
MQKITLFTLFYAALGILLSTIALQHNNMDTHFVRGIWIYAGVTYLAAFLSTFPFWRCGILNRRERMHRLPVWQQVLFQTLAYIVFAIVVLSPLYDGLTQGWTSKNILLMYEQLPFIVFGVEQFAARNPKIKHSKF